MFFFYSICVHFVCVWKREMCFRTLWLLSLFHTSKKCQLQNRYVIVLASCSTVYWTCKHRLSSNLCYTTQTQQKYRVTCHNQQINKSYKSLNIIVCLARCCEISLCHTSFIHYFILGFKLNALTNAIFLHPIHVLFVCSSLSSLLEWNAISFFFLLCGLVCCRHPHTVHTLHPLSPHPTHMTHVLPVEFTAPVDWLTCLATGGMFMIVVYDTKLL